MSRRALYGLLGAEAVSVTGTRMSVIAVPWFVLQSTGSPLQTGLVAFVELGALVVARTFGGPVVDRLGSRRASIGGDAFAAVTLGLVPVLHLLDLLSFPMLVLLVGLTGFFRGPSDSAKYVAVPDLAAQGNLSLERVSGLVDGTNRVGSLIGMPLGAALVAVLGSPAVIALNAATFALAAVLVAALVRLPRPVRDAAAGSAMRRYVAELREGFAFVLGDRFFVAVATMVFVTNLLDQALGGVLLPVWADERYGTAAVLGVVSGAFAGGAVIGTVLITAYGERLPRRRTFAWAFLLGAVPRIFVLALPVGLPVVAAVNLLGGVLVGAINPMLSAAEFDRVPPALRARVIGAVGGLAWAGMPLGGLLGGWLAMQLGVTTAIVIVGVTYLVVTLDPFIRPAWRLMDRGAPGTLAPEPVTTSRAA